MLCLLSQTRPLYDPLDPVLTRFIGLTRRFSMQSSMLIARQCSANPGAQGTVTEMHGLAFIEREGRGALSAPIDPHPCNWQDWERLCLLEQRRSAWVHPVVPITGIHFSLILAAILPTSHRKVATRSSSKVYCSTNTLRKYQLVVSSQISKPKNVSIASKSPSRRDNSPISADRSTPSCSCSYAMKPPVGPLGSPAAEGGG